MTSPEGPQVRRRLVQSGLLAAVAIAGGPSPVVAVERLSMPYRVAVERRGAPVAPPAAVAVASRESAAPSLAVDALVLRSGREQAVEIEPLPDIAVAPGEASSPPQVVARDVPATQRAAEPGATGLSGPVPAVADAGGAPVARARPAWSNWAIERPGWLSPPQSDASGWPWAALLAAVALSVWRMTAARARRRHVPPGFHAAELAPLVARGPGQLEGAPQIEALCELTMRSVAALDAAPPLQEVLEGEVRQARQRLAAAVAGVAAGRDDLASRRAAAMCRNIVRDLDRVRRIADSAVVSFRGTEVGIAPPQTRAEAYAVLGVNPDVGDATLKKLADALRMSWHPDHARDDADRRRREARTKQINIALDMIRAGRVQGAA